MPDWVVPDEDLRSYIVGCGSDGPSFGFQKGDYRISQHIDELVPYVLAMRQEGPAHYLEVGLAGGGMFRLMAELLELDSAEAIDPGDHLSAGMIAQNLGAMKCHVNLVRGSSHDASSWGRLDRNAFDLILVDGDHSYRGVSQDAEWASQYTRDGGIVAFHDTNGDPGVRKFRKDLEDGLAQELGLSLAGKAVLGGRFPGIHWYRKAAT